MKIDDGTISMPTRASTTVTPLKRTARLAVEPAGADRVVHLATRGPLLAVAGEDEERVVDPDGEAHHRQHVHDEERELEDLADGGRDRQRDDDRDDREADGTSAATTAPKTTSRISSAIGMPKSSPVCRSFSA